MSSMLCCLALTLGCLLIQHQPRVSALRRRPKVHDNVPLDVDIRGNRIAEAQAETIWAVRVLNSAGMPNKQLKDVWLDTWDGEQRTNMDLLWAWIDAMQRNDAGNVRPFMLDPPMDEEANMKNENPAAFVAAMQTGHHFKNGKDQRGRKVFGMDYYINHRLKKPDDIFCVLPDGELWSMKDRHDTVRAEPLFQYRGRVAVKDLSDDEPMKYVMLVRQDSKRNAHAGITSLESMPEEAWNFFDTDVTHGGKNSNVRTGDYNTSFLFEQLGAPFIAGPSGSIEYMILAMEDDCAGTCEDGLVPFQIYKVREALLSVMTAALIAGGQHSLGECLAVAQAMGYFLEVPSILEDYHLAAETFESYSANVLGVVASESYPLSQMRTIRLKQLASDK